LASCVIVWPAGGEPVRARAGCVHWVRGVFRVTLFQIATSDKFQACPALFRAISTHEERSSSCSAGADIGNPLNVHRACDPLARFVFVSGVPIVAEVADGRRVGNSSRERCCRQLTLVFADAHCRCNFTRAFTEDNGFFFFFSRPKTTSLRPQSGIASEEA